MYVCICHGIRCRDVKEAAQKGIVQAEEVFRHFAVEPSCGRCLGTMCGMLDCQRDGTALPGMSPVEPVSGIEA